MKIEIRYRFTRNIIISGKYDTLRECLEKNRGADLEGADLEGADLRGADLEGAYLRGAYLRGADLEDAYLGGAYLRGAYLRGAKGYVNAHDIFAEVVRRQEMNVFIDKEWSAIAQITIHRLCWDSIEKRFPNIMPHIFEVLAQAGFTEWLEYWNKMESKGHRKHCGGNLIQ